MRCKIFILAGLLLFWSSTLFGGVFPSEWDSYCRKCHIDRPVNSLYDPSIKAHTIKSVSCVACHRNKGIAGHVKESAESFYSLFQDMTLPPDVRPQSAASMTSADCLICHPSIEEVDQISEYKLPKELRAIGLRAAHGRHWDYRTFTPKQRDEWRALQARKVKSTLSKTEQDTLDRLTQNEKMQCSSCHERFRKDSPGGIDSNVNIAMKNPMECTVCHVGLRTAIHPGDSSLLPSAVSCQRCHNGKLHQKMIFSPVNYGTKDDCLRCHPDYSADKVVAGKPEQFNHKSLGVPVHKAQERQQGSSGMLKPKGMTAPGSKY
jgi:hypothetical protein